MERSSWSVLFGYQVVDACLNILSVVSSAALITFLKMNNQMINSRLVFWASVCVILLNLRRAIAFLGTSPDVTSAQCYASLIMGMFSLAALSSWYFLISVRILQTVRGASNLGIVSSHLFCWATAAALTAIPLGKGEVKSNEDGSCWLADGANTSRLFFTLILLLFFVLASVFSLYAWCKIKRSQQLSKHLVRKRMFGFVVVFLLSLALPIAHEISLLSSGASWPQALQAVASLLVSAIGMSNLTVWVLASVKKMHFGSRHSDAFDSTTDGDEFEQVVISRPVSAGGWSEGLLSSTAGQDRGHINSLSESSGKRPSPLSLSAPRIAGNSFSSNNEGRKSTPNLPLPPSHPSSFSEKK